MPGSQAFEAFLPGASHSHVSCLALHSAWSLQQLFQLFQLCSSKWSSMWISIWSSIYIYIYIYIQSSSIWRSIWNSIAPGELHMDVHIERRMELHGDLQSSPICLKGCHALRFRACVPHTPSVRMMVVNTNFLKS